VLTASKNRKTMPPRASPQFNYQAGVTFGKVSKCYR
jgi:hypothetical protein